VIELGRHIEILLLDNDCVIVPNFGGFVAHQVSAHYDERDRMWLPPTRTIGFNPQLRINDSLLAQSYVTAYDISYPEALQRIEDEVDKVKSMLDNEGCYTIDNIGKISVNMDGNYMFEPCEAGILSPDYYGLGTYEFATLKVSMQTPVMVPDKAEMSSTSVTANDTAAEATVDTEGNEHQPTLLEFTDNEEERYEEHAIQIKMSWIRNTVAIAAAVIAFFIMATPIANSDLNTRTMSKLQGSFLQRLMPKDTNVVPRIKPQASKKEEVTETVTTPTEKATSPKATTVAPEAPHYCIVLASQVKRSNAEYYVEQLKKQGYDAKVNEHNGTVRVVMGDYETEGEAYQQLNRLVDNEEFAEAWVYKMKN
jgi:cell division protein FtsN